MAEYELAEAPSPPSEADQAVAQENEEIIGLALALEEVTHPDSPMGVGGLRFMCAQAVTMICRLRPDLVRQDPPSEAAELERLRALVAQLRTVLDGGAVKSRLRRMTAGLEPAAVPETTPPLEES